MASIWTADDLVAAKAALLQAMTTGKMVTFGGRSWTSHDLPELRALVADIERQSTGAPGHRLAAVRKGV
jgi:hypothetical protein